MALITDCLLYAVGKPVYHRYTGDEHGCWMRDSSPKSDTAGEKLWVTKSGENSYLYEYENKTLFRKDARRQITLPYKFKVFRPPCNLLSYSFSYVYETCMMNAGKFIFM